MNSLAQLLQTFDLAQMDRELAQKGYIHFVRSAWDQVEPAQPFVNSWHVGAVCEHLEAVFDDEIQLLVINVPPSTSKSMLCSVMFDPWVWTQEPEHKFIHGCYDQRLARRDSLRAKGLIESRWYKERWGDVYRLKSKGEARNTGDEYRTDKGGFRIITTPGGSVTGEHGNTHIIDDPIKPIETMGDKAITQNELLKLIDWHDGTMANRFVDFSKRKRVIIMQRLHEIDLAGVCIERGYEHLMLPMEFEPERKCFTSIGFEDPRKEDRELLCPERFDQATVDQMFDDLGGRGSRNAEAQLQQSPVSIRGDIFKRGLEQYYKELPDSFDQMIQSWDCTFKKTKAGSYVAGQVWGRNGANYYLIDQARGRWSFSETVNQVRYLTRKWPRAIKKLVEDKANGPAIVDHLKNEISGMTEAPPHGDKEARANAVEPYWSSGNVFLPHPSIAPWIEAFVNECTKFPASKNDDQCFAAGTMIATPNGNRKIEDLRIGDAVIVPGGISKVTAAGQTGISQIINIEGLNVTPGHPIFTYEKGFIKIDALTQALSVDKLSLGGQIKWTYRKQLYLRESHTSSWGRNDIILASRKPAPRVPRGSMWQSGNPTTGKRLRRAMSFTISMAIHIITILKIWSVYRVRSIGESIQSRIWKSRSNTLREFVHWLRRGTVPQRERLGIESTLELLVTESPKNGNAPIVGNASYQKESLSTVQTNVDIREEGQRDIMTENLNVSYVEKHSKQCSRSTPKELEKLAAKSVKQNCEEGILKEPVYNLTVEGAGCYYANGILVSNCDAMTQALDYLGKSAMKRLQAAMKALNS